MLFRSGGENIIRKWVGGKKMETQLKFKRLYERERRERGSEIEKLKIFIHFHKFFSHKLIFFPPHGVPGMFGGKNINLLLKINHYFSTSSYFFPHMGPRYVWGKKYQSFVDKKSLFFHKLIFLPPHGVPGKLGERILIFFFYKKSLFFPKNSYFFPHMGFAESWWKKY